MISQKEVQEKLNEEFKELESKISRPNILIVGGTGVGKSSLINKIFGKEVAKTSNSKPETRGINVFEHKDVILLDTEGFELGEEKNIEFENKILDEINKRKNEKPENHIHLIWHLISGSSDRLTDYDKDLYDKLNKHKIPVALVFTKCDLATESGLDKMLKIIYTNKNFHQVFEDKNDPPFFVSSATDEYDLSPNFLIEWSAKNLSESLRFAFVSSQVLNYEEKYKVAQSIVYQHSAGNALIGFSPIPFSDAPILIASQIGMLARIVRVYNISSLDVNSFMKTTGAGIVISNLGKTAVASLLKFIPVVGTLVGGAINASVASAITYAMGTALNTILKNLIIKVLKKDAEGVNETIDNFSEIFKQEFKNKFTEKQKNEKKM